MVCTEKIRNRILVNQKMGNPFAFMIDVKDFEQMWYVVNFQYYEFVPVPLCNYFIQIQRVKDGKITSLSESEFKDLADLVQYLSEKKVNPDYCRAMH